MTTRTLIRTACMTAIALTLVVSTTGCGDSITSPDPYQGQDTGYTMPPADVDVSPTQPNGDGDVRDEVGSLLEYSTHTRPVTFGPQLMPGTSVLGSTQYGAYVADEATQGAGNGGGFLNPDIDSVDKLVVLVVGDPEAVEQGSDKHPERYSGFGPVTILPLRDPMTLEVE